MQCKDIPDAPVLRFLRERSGERCTWGNGYGVMSSVQDAMPENTPGKLQLAKMSTLKRRGYISGCPCGCSGGFEITPKGLEALAEMERAS